MTKSLPMESSPIQAGQGRGMERRRLEEMNNHTVSSSPHQPPASPWKHQGLLRPRPRPPAPHFL